MPGAGNPSPVWEKGRDEGLPYPIEAAAASLRSGNQRRSLTPAPLPSGRGVLSRFQRPIRIGRKLIPALRTSRMIRRIPSPRGGRPEACRLAGWVRRLRARVAPRSREASGTDLGTLRSLREELARLRRFKPAR